MTGRTARKRLIRTASRAFPGSAQFAVPLVLGWARARVEAVRRHRGLIRGTAVVWPSSGRAWTAAEDVARPGREEVLIHVHVTAISSGTERAFFARLPGSPGKFPFFPGYSAAGEITEAGSGIRQFARGDRVALVAGHTSVARAKVDQILGIPSGVSMEEAAFVQLGVIALQAVQKASLRLGETVAVIGHGVIGQLIAQIVAASGHRVLSVARTDRRLTEPLVRAASRIVLLERDGVEGLEALGPDVTLEVSGSPDAIPVAIRATRPGGRIVLAGSTRGTTRETDFGLLADKTITVIGAHITSLEAKAWPLLARIFLDLLGSRRIEVASLISARIDPREAEWFYRRLARQDDATIGAVFVWDRLPAVDRMRRIGFVAPPDISPMRRGRLTVLPISRRGALPPSHRLRPVRSGGEGGVA